MELSAVLAVWQHPAMRHDPGPSASTADVAAVSELLGRPLPEQLTELYRRSGAGECLGGTLSLAPLLPVSGDQDGDELTVATTSHLLRSWDWPIPEELILFAIDDLGQHCGVWAPADDPQARPLVVATDEVFEPACLVVVGDDVAAFLAAWTVHYLVRNDGPVESLKPLKVPDGLLDGEVDDDDYLARLLSWASPGLPDPAPDVFARGLTAHEVAAWARRD